MHIAEKGNCQIFGAFGIMIQGALGILSFTALLLKRFWETPKRPLRIFVLDVSKQAFSALLAHLINLTLAYILSEENISDDCVWYMINIVIDVGVGVLLNFLFLRSIEAIAEQLGIEILRSGVYLPEDISDVDEFEHIEPSTSADIVDYRIWTIQLVVWLIIIVIVKILLFGVQKVFAPNLELIGRFILSPVAAMPRLKLLIIMVIIPVILNSCQFWVQDNFLKAKEETTRMVFEKRKREFLRRRNSLTVGMNPAFF